jgi:hypothetical protein
MASSLRGRLDDLATAFVTDLFDVVRRAPIEEILGAASNESRRIAPSRAATVASRQPASSAAPPRRRPGRLPRRSAEDIGEIVERIVELVKAHPGGLRAEQIRKELALDAKELPRPLSEAVDAGRLGKSGQKRATTYFVKTSATKRVARSGPKRRTPGEAPAATQAKPGRRPSGAGGAAGAAGGKGKRAESNENTEATTGATEVPAADGVVAVG